MSAQTPPLSGGEKRESEREEVEQRRAEEAQNENLRALVMSANRAVAIDPMSENINKKLLRRATIETQKKTN